MSLQTETLRAREEREKGRTHNDAANNAGLQWDYC